MPLLYRPRPYIPLQADCTKPTALIKITTKLTPAITLGSSGQFRCRTALSWRRVYRIKITCTIGQSVRAPSVRASVGHRHGRDGFVIDQPIHVRRLYSSSLSGSPRIGKLDWTLQKNISCSIQRHCSSTVHANDNACDNKKAINRRATPTLRVIQTKCSRFVLQTRA